MGNWICQAIQFIVSSSFVLLYSIHIQPLFRVCKAYYMKHYVSLKPWYATSSRNYSQHRALLNKGREANLDICNTAESNDQPGSIGFRCRSKEAINNEKDVCTLKLQLQKVYY